MSVLQNIITERDCFFFMALSAGAAEFSDWISTDSCNECPRYDTKQSDGEARVMLEVFEMLSTPLLASLPGLCTELFEIELFKDRTLA